MIARASTLPRKRSKPSQDATDDGGSKQIAFRAPGSLVKRIDDAAEQLGLDPSNFLRMMLLECLPIYEERGRLITERKASPGVKPDA